MLILKLFGKAFIFLILLAGCQSNNSTKDPKVQNKIQELTEYFGEANLRKDLGQKIFFDRDSVAYVKYVTVRITHIPTGKSAVGESSEDQSLNMLEALVLLKKETEKGNKLQK